MQSNHIDDLMQLKELYEKGIISKDELTAAKAKIFAKEDINSPNTKPIQNKNLIKILLFTVVIALLIGAIVLLIRSNRNPADPDPVEEIEVQTETVQEEIVPEDVIPFNLVSEKPSFNGGDFQTFSKWVNSNLNYPESERIAGVSGKVVLSFIIDKDGYVRNVKVVRDLDPVLDNEAVRVIKSSPKWQPAKNNGKNVAVKVTFPIIIQQ